MKNLATVPLTMMLFSATGYASSGDHIGVLVSSYGDVDSPTEAKSLVTNTVGDPDVLGLPEMVSRAIADASWGMVARETLDEYDAIGGRTNYRAVSQRQADCIAASLRERGYNATGYAGFTMTSPRVDDALAKAQADGVDQLVVWYQGAQYSHVSTYIVFRDVKQYLQQHPEWQVQVVGVRSFYREPEFIDLVADGIQERLNSPEFRGATDVCLFLPLHGNTMKWTKKGDPYYNQTLESVAAVRERFPGLDVSYGFQNHDQFPLIKWTSPKDEAVLADIAQKPCSHVIINGQLTFTVDNLETLYDQNIGERQVLNAKTGGGKTIAVEPMFNAQAGFVDFLARQSIKALQGEGDVEALN